MLYIQNFLIYVAVDSICSYFIMRKYKKKLDPKVKRNKMTQEKLDTALHLLKGGSSIRKSAKEIGVNESTLRTILNKRKDKGLIQDLQKITSRERGMTHSLPPEEDIVPLEGSSEMESFIVRTMIHDTTVRYTSTPQKKKRLKQKHAELFTCQEILDNLKDQETTKNKRKAPTQKGNKKKVSKQTNQEEDVSLENSKATKKNIAYKNSHKGKESEEESEHEAEEIGGVIYDDSSDPSLDDTDADIVTNKIGIHFHKRSIPKISKLKLEKLYVIGYYDASKTKLYIGKLKQVNKDTNKCLFEFMDRIENDTFIWRKNPQQEEVIDEQVIIGPLLVQYDHGIIVTGMHAARSAYIDYFKSSKE